MSSSFRTIAVFILSISHAESGAIDFLHCPADITTTGLIFNVIIPSCDAIPCVFYKGNSYSIEMDFENLKDTFTLTPKVFGSINGIVVPWMGIDPNGCDHMITGQCPLKTGDYVTWGYGLKVDDGYPTVDATVRWILEGDDGVAIFCFEFPVLIR